MSKKQQRREMAVNIYTHPVDQIMCTPEQVRRARLLVADWAARQWPGDDVVDATPPHAVRGYVPDEEAVVATATVLDALGIGGL